MLGGQNLHYHCHCPPKKPDEISGNSQDHDTLATGPTHSTVAPAFEGGAITDVLRPSGGPTTPTGTHSLVAFMKEAQALVAHL